MKRKALLCAAHVLAVFALAAGINAAAQNPQVYPVKVFSGQIDAYSPQNAKGGPYQVHGPWSLVVKPDGTSEFSAAVNMELSDGWVLTRNSGNFDPTTRDAHTHHITMFTNGITLLPNGGFKISGTATVTLNGGQAPVSPTPLTVSITGGTEVEYSNLSLTFGSPGSNHFGTAPLTGVVRSVRSGR